MPQRDGRSIGGLYRTGQVVATSSMLTTYTAYDSNTNDVVGLYVIEAHTDEQLAALPSISQFLTKRQSIQSTHIIKLYNWGIEGRRIYIATDPPRGVTLQHVLNTENIDIPRALDLCKQLAIALTVFHAAGIAGLDLRPLLITIDTIGITDRVQIDDIGLRSLLKSLNYMIDQRQDDIGFLDPRYAPPEYIQSGAIGPWSDIYQVGILLFMLLTGRLPFTGRTVAETSILQATNPVPLMSRYVHGLPEGLQKIVEQCMEKDPARRFSSAIELITALEKLQRLVQPAASGSIEPAGVVPTREISSLDIDAARREAQGKKKEVHSLSHQDTDGVWYLRVSHLREKGKRKEV